MNGLIGIIYRDYSRYLKPLGWPPLRQPNFGRPINFSSWIQTGATIVVAWFAIGQAHAAQEQARAADEELRPWIKINSLSLRSNRYTLIWSDQFGHKLPMLLWTGTVQNVGRSVAHIAVDPELFYGQSGGNWHQRVVDERDRYCNSSVVLRPSGPPAETTLFPGESTSVGYEAGAPLETSPYADAAYLIVCVTYRGAIGTQYQTQAFGELFEDGNASIVRNLNQSGSHLQFGLESGSDVEN